MTELKLLSAFDCVSSIEKTLENAISNTMLRLLAQPAKVDVVSDYDDPTSDLWFYSELKTIRLPLIFGVNRQQWKSSGRALLDAASEDHSDDETTTASIQAIVTQIGAALANSWGIETGQELRYALIETKEERPSDSTLHRALVKIGMPDQTQINLAVMIDRKLFSYLGSVSQSGAQPAPSTPNSKNLDLLLDVEMPVSVSFGKAQIALKDVIKLTTGSIVELNRNISEPVDIIVKNCVIARGEVVVVDGNFGVRIKDVLSKEVRLDKLS
jgi:flagellar motor switch protein FliN/FliY